MAIANCSGQNTATLELFHMNPLDPEGDGVGVGLGDFTLEALVSPLETGRGAQVFMAQKNGTGLGRSNALITENELGGVSCRVTRWPCDRR